jgi:hypothetical protein
VSDANQLEARILFHEWALSLLLFFNAFQIYSSGREPSVFVLTMAFGALSMFQLGRMITSLYGSPRAWLKDTTTEVNDGH